MADERLPWPEWACLKCGSPPASAPQPSTDVRDRWRVGWCVKCKKKNAIFRRLK